MSAASDRISGRGAAIEAFPDSESALVARKANLASVAAAMASALGRRRKTDNPG